MPKFRATEGREARYSSYVTLDELEFITSYRELNDEQKAFFADFMGRLTSRNREANPPNVVALRR